MHAEKNAEGHGEYRAVDQVDLNGSRRCQAFDRCRLTPMSLFLANGYSSHTVFFEGGMDTTRVRAAHQRAVPCGHHSANGRGIELRD